MAAKAGIQSGDDFLASEIDHQVLTTHSQGPHITEDGFEEPLCHGKRKRHLQSFSLCELLSEEKPQKLLSLPLLSLRHRRVHILEATPGIKVWFSQFLFAAADLQGASQTEQESMKEMEGERMFEKKCDVIATFFLRNRLVPFQKSVESQPLIYFLSIDHLFPFHPRLDGF